MTCPVKFLLKALFLLIAIHFNASCNTGNFVDLPICPTQAGLKWDSCVGSFAFLDGTIYEGQWKNNKPHGRGKFKLSNGDIFTSEFNGGSYSQVGEYVNSKTKTHINAVWNMLENKPIFNYSQIFQSSVQGAQPIKKVTDLAKDNPSDDKRLALVIGNSKYLRGALKNPKNDADDISRALKQMGFYVIDVRDGSLQDMRQAIRLFGDQLATNNVGVVYYSGHAVEVKGRNYIVPINAEVKREDEIVDQALDIALILEKMKSSNSDINILILDACRDDPFGRGFRSLSRGLANINAPVGTMVAYSTSPGEVASDGDEKERNSPYTKHLLRLMSEPNWPVEKIFKEVRKAVRAETNGKQTPWENTSLSGDFYFNNLK